MKTIKLISMTLLALCVFSIDKMLATGAPAGNSCPPLSKALISPNHRIYQQLNSHYYERIKASGFMHGYHATAVALLVCQSVEVGHRYVPLAGTWYADPIIAVGDDHGQPDRYGFATSTSTNPDRNLYQLARDEFEDISYQAIAMLCLAQDGFAEEIAEKAAKQSSLHLFVQLGNVVMLVGSESLSTALAQSFGREWQKLYRKEFANRS